MTTETDVNWGNVNLLHDKLVASLNGVQLGVAGRVVYYDKEQQMFILGMHSASPEKTQEATQLAWDNIPPNLKAEMREVGISFAGKQI